MSKKIKAAITQGDPNGIGIEVILKSVLAEGITELFTPVIFGDADLFQKWKSRNIRQASDEKLPEINIVESVDEIKDGFINIIDIPFGENEQEMQPGIPTSASGTAALNALHSAIESLKRGKTDILVTAPICKENVVSEEFPFAGHTEYLEKELGNEEDKSLMILFDGPFRVALVTTHIPVAELPDHISKESIMEKAMIFDRSLRQDFGIERPKIAVLSLNPHSGDGGVIGKEEIDVISPAIEALREKGMLVFGPYAADGFFGDASQYKFDGVLAMYHDQGLTPFKTLSGKSGVNFTAGLPYVRTSPDHGTAFDIAGKGIADETSMKNAIYEGIDIFRRRENYRAASANPLRFTVQSRPDREERQPMAPKLNGNNPRSENAQRQENNFTANASVKQDNQPRVDQNSKHGYTPKPEHNVNHFQKESPKILVESKTSEGPKTPASLPAPRNIGNIDKPRNIDKPERKPKVELDDKAMPENENSPE